MIMVRFEKDRFIVEIKTGTNPMEDWLNLVHGLLSVLQAQETGSGIEDSNRPVYWLLQNMMPEWEDAKRMV